MELEKLLLIVREQAEALEALSEEGAHSEDEHGGFVSSSSVFEISQTLNDALDAFSSISAKK
jgi:hypothetical protein